MREGINRRDVLLNGSSALAGAAIASIAPVSITSAIAQLPSRRPNIVYIVADDLGWKDVGFHGSDIKTPNIDRLAQNGARLEEFYVQPMCTPTRAALMTGRYPCRYGLQTLVIPTPSKYGLPTDERLLPQALKEAGYRTAMVGKWHLGHADRKYWPRQRGFDYHYGSMVGEVDYFTHSSANVRDWYRDDRPVKERGYVTQLWGTDAVAQINAHDPRTPLFLYLAFTAPHSPYQAPKEYIDKYRHIEDPTRRTYAAMITCMDDEIGKVVAALEKKKMRENTLIVFMSDNGGNQTAMLAGDADVSNLKLPADNGPYRGGKGMLYEGGTRVAALRELARAYQARRGEGSDARGRHVPDTGRARGSQPHKGKAARRARRLVDDQQGLPRHARRSSTTSNHSAGACARAIGSSSGARRCRPHWSCTIWLKTRRKKRISPTESRDGCGVAEADRGTCPGKRQIPVPDGRIRCGQRRRPWTALATERGCVLHAG